MGQKSKNTNLCGIINVSNTMRRQSLWLRLFALFVLIPLVVPMSAQAAFCLAHPVGMKCCMKQPVVQTRTAKPRHSCCESHSEPAISAQSGPTIQSDDTCKCSWKSAPKIASIDSDLAPVIRVPSGDQTPLAWPVQSLFITDSGLQFSPAFFFGDSSPPIDGHPCASSGRAPPTSVA